MTVLSITVRVGFRENIYRLRFWEFEHPKDLVFEDACEGAERTVDLCLSSVAEAVAARKALTQPKTQTSKAV